MNWVWPAIVSMTPFIELRAGIPLALATGVNPVFAFFVCVLANILVIPLLFFFLEFIHFRFLHVDGYRNIFDRFMERMRRKTEKYVEKYGVVGLAIITALPFPGTGAYSATVAGWFFGLGKWRTFLAVSVGVVFAGSIMMGASLGLIALLL